MLRMANDVDADFERRWIAWKARGVAHECRVRQGFLAVAMVVAAIALAPASAYGLLCS
jgi:hypothetical protein